MKVKDEFLLFFRIVLGKIASARKALNKFFPPQKTEVTTFYLFSVCIKTKTKQLKKESRHVTPEKCAHGKQLKREQTCDSGEMCPW